MGRIKRGILGGFSGKVANIIGGSWKGLEYMRSRPLSVANPKTAAQTSNRTQFANAVAFAIAILAYAIKPLNDRFAQFQSGYNLFVQRNKDFFGTTPQTITDPQDIELSRGSLDTVPDFVAAQGGTIQEAEASWTDNSGTGNASADDIVYIVAFNEDTGEVKGGPTTFERQNPMGGVTLLETVSPGETIHIWAALRKTDGSAVSNTVYDSYAAA